MKLCYKNIPFIQIISSQMYLKQVTRPLILVDKIEHGLKKARL